jgi:hypothetical protein
VIHRIALLTAIAIVIVAAGCGSDESGQEDAAPTVSIPEVTNPLGTTTTTPASTIAPGTTPTSKGGKTFDPNLPDSETNDVPPPPGSPQEAFEKECKQAPLACG